MTRKALLLFDVDGTLALSQRRVDRFFVELFRRLSSDERFHVGVVSGSDDKKICKQFDVPEMTDLFMGSCLLHSPLLKFGFFENGVLAYESVPNKPVGAPVGNPVGAGAWEVRTLSRLSLREYLGDKKLDEIKNLIKSRFSTLNLRWDCENKIEERTGTLNVSPIGRSCSLKEREEFKEFDQESNLRRDLKSQFHLLFGNENNLAVALGGDISLDIFPVGWSKAFVLDSVLNSRLEDYQEIHFFGDRCSHGGNDFDLYTSKFVTHPNAVTGPDHTRRLLQALLKEYCT